MVKIANPPRLVFLQDTPEVELGKQTAHATNTLVQFVDMAVDQKNYCKLAREQLRVMQNTKPGHVTSEDIDELEHKIIIMEYKAASLFYKYEQLQQRSQKDNYPISAFIEKLFLDAKRQFQSRFIDLQDSIDVSSPADAQNSWEYFNFWRFSYAEAEENILEQIAQGSTDGHYDDSLNRFTYDEASQHKLAQLRQNAEDTLSRLHSAPPKPAKKQDTVNVFTKMFQGWGRKSKP